MSRISGFIRPDGLDTNAIHSVKRMLKVLPGVISLDTEGPGSMMGWCGWVYDVSGTVRRREEVSIAIDGRILNTQGLCEQLGVADDDISIVFALYRKYGFKDALTHLMGDFAIALYDIRRRTAWLGRDRMGVKPLYYTKCSGGISFASQPGALLVWPDVSRRVNTGFVARFAGSHYRTFDNFPNQSPYADIRQLPAGHVVQYSGGDVGEPESYWRLEEMSEWTDDENALAERYREKLIAAVSRRQAVADSPIFSLSGGLDSSSVLCCAVEITGKKQCGVSVIYADATFDERDEINDVVEEKVSDWEAVELGNDIDLFDYVSKMVRIHDEPVATATWLSHFRLCGLVSESGFMSLFGGLGGDELNAGEYEYFPFFFADLKSTANEELVRQEIEAWAAHHDHPIYKKDLLIAERLIKKLTDADRPGRCLADEGRMFRYRDAVRRDYFDLTSFHATMEGPFRSYLKNRTYQDMFLETLPCCLRAEDRQCTAAGLQHFDPFLDHELVEYMYRIPGIMKIRNGTTKQLLRRAMVGILPEITRTRIKKTGWNAPAHMWFSGRGADDLRDLVSSKEFRERGIYDVAVVESLLREHENLVASSIEAENHMMFFWQLVNMELWVQSIDDPLADSWISSRNVNARSI